MNQNSRTVRNTETSDDFPVVPVVLSGGVGARLWPLSREAHPKPFIKLDDGESLLQKTYLRASNLSEVKEIITVTNRDLFFYTKDEYKEVETSSPFNSYILEPFGRNSSGAIAMAAEHARQKYGENCILLILPADHLIENQDVFRVALDEAKLLAKNGTIVTFGIAPSSPQTGYGYIEAKGNDVVRFVEKPNIKEAQEYVSSGNYFWNSGMFCVSVDTIISEMRSLMPQLMDQALFCLNKAKKADFENGMQLEVQPEDMGLLEDISIDYAVLEKSAKVSMVQCEFGWSDIGSWVEFGHLHEKDALNNHFCGEVILEETKNCIVHSESRLVATVGLENLIIADTQDALLVADKSRSQDVRSIVKSLKEKSHETYQYFPTVYRPWGSYTTLQEAPGFKIKRIEVKPGAQLSLQSHKHRSEHWVVVSGSAIVLNGEDTLQLEHNQSTYIPIGNKHRLQNPNEDMLILIEVQCGDYLGEDDIVRYDDIYGRQ